MLRRTIRSLCPAASAGAAATSSQPLSPEKAAFLEQFRAKVANDTEGKDSLDGFVESVETPISAASVGPIQRGSEPLPKWLKLKIPKGISRQPKYNRILSSMKEKKLSTVCQEAKCPNIGECWGGGDGDHEAATATIMLMGAHCTRGCRFCSVLTSRTPPPLDPLEPEKTADAIADMGVDYIVMTMVDRDDLADGGAEHVKRCIEKVKEKNPTMLLEALVGDFKGNTSLVEVVASSPLNVYAHNIECVERITPNVRDRRATYRQSLGVLEHAAKFSQGRMLTKSSIMLGLGEEVAEVRQTLRDLRSAGVSAVTLGQYLQPSRTRLKVSRYAHPDEFAMWEREALDMGFVYCASGPMVRSSYRAGEYYLTNYIKKQQQEQQQKQANKEEPQH
eukprot:CAMPEP_0176406252 /NCGR_PEP_ID=MMETSP0127-20121128/772_1 /TAXON_ID=938130 /ORGANISM="Platyophrya macrostoma, Strain WH" /LENGTH=390 /DNA_ID=CAMNT_0017785365 /DNA_START=38 /DNA_END=1210 /DNA_ORIENTATION=+